MNCFGICSDKPNLIRQDLNPVNLRSKPFLNGHTKEHEVESGLEKEPKVSDNRILFRKLVKQNTF
jgi:hypothetical protein